MSKLEIKLNNCFGIETFDYSFDISKDNNTIMIYAPNGTMKTSLARTFLCLEINQSAADLLDETKESSYSFLLDGNKITNNQVYVYKTEDNQIVPNGISSLEEDNISSFLSSPNEVKQYKEILKPIDIILNQIEKRFDKLINHGKKNIFQKEVLEVFKQKGVLAKYNSICDAIVMAKNFNNSEKYDGFFYNELFDQNGVSKKYINSYFAELTNPEGGCRKRVKVKNTQRWNRICEIVDSNPYIKARIGDIEILKKEYLLSFIKKEIKLFLEYYALYMNKKNELTNIITNINSDTELWDQVISNFNSRFHAPYKLQLENKADFLLNQEFLYIKYFRDKTKKIIEYKNKGHFLNFISTGEKRAYYLLVNLFEIEKRKKNKEKQIIVIDDVAESFDYKNKYAIVEYLAEIRECKNFILIILTHNFDFYRTIYSRLNVSNIYIANRDNEGRITLQDGAYVRDIIKNKLIKHINSSRCLIALIPFVRNIIEYTKGVDSKDYHDLTTYLHIKPQTNILTMKDLMNTVSSNIYIGHKTILSSANNNYLETLYNEAEKAYISKDDIAIENKLILSMAIRLSAESFILNELANLIDINSDVHANQTRYLYDKYRTFNPNNVKQNKVLEKVLMMTSENIHINNFMFEPIIDISSRHLKELYKEVRNLK